jgi:hypothetical protein
MLVRLKQRFFFFIVQNLLCRHISLESMQEILHILYRSNNLNKLQALELVWSFSPGWLAATAVRFSAETVIFVTSLEFTNGLLTRHTHDGQIIDYTPSK